MAITQERFKFITEQFPKLTITLLGDFCLDRYLEIDPSLKETSIETGLTVYNVINVRAQPGGAGTILNNLVALGIGRIIPIGFVGLDGEGFELLQALKIMKNVDLRYFIQTPLRRTFTYCKPLVIASGKPPIELNRLDFKNWSPTPEELQYQFAEALAKSAPESSGIVLLEQVDKANTGVITKIVLEKIKSISEAYPHLHIIADSRRGLSSFPPIIYKMNSTELARMTGSTASYDIEKVKQTSALLSRRTGKYVFVTLGEKGILGAAPDGTIYYQPALPPRGEIDIVGAGDAVIANLISALAAGATMEEAITIANAAGWIVIHKLGTTGTASINELHAALFK